MTSAKCCQRTCQIISSAVFAKACCASGVEPKFTFLLDDSGQALKLVSQGSPAAGNVHKHRTHPVKAAGVALGCLVGGPGSPSGRGIDGCGLPGPGKQVGDLAGRMIRQSDEHVGEPCLWIEAVELGGLDQRVD